MNAFSTNGLKFHCRPMTFRGWRPVGFQMDFWRPTKSKRCIYMCARIQSELFRHLIGLLLPTRHFREE